MVRTYSTMLPLGTLLPHFSLLDVVSNKLRASTALPQATGYLIMVICNHCPYVVHVRKEMLRFAAAAQQQGVEVLAVSANDPVAYPADAPAKMQELALAEKFTFPYLFDESQEFVKALQAVCTPEFYFFDDKRRLFYRGRMDESSPGNGLPTNAWCLEAALKSLVQGTELRIAQEPSLGCNIKWKQ